MSENYKDILSNLSTEVDQALLLQYLAGKLSDEEHHAIEKQLAASEFETDALEGLENFKDKEQLQYMVEMLNRDLKNKTAKKKKRREKMRIKDQPWLWMSILILFILIVLCFILIRKLSA
ncbi:MAG: hypothetical protein RIR12_862 [Bacteroidota bacterium]|jgi:hypothetical protein